MKKLLLIMLAFTMSYAVNAQIQTPAPSPASKFEQKVGLTDVTIDYYSPSMRGRTIFGGLVPYGKVWRTGANANTKITFGDHVTIDGQELKKGTYAVYTIPNASSGEVILSSDPNNGGTPQKWEDIKVVGKTTVQATVIGDNSK